MMKKTLSLILALVMILGSFGVVLAEGEATPAATEAPAAETEAPAMPVVENAKVKWLQENGYLKGRADGNLALADTITRAEFATILVRGMGMEAEAIRSMGLPSKFVDMNGHWANGYVEVAVGLGLVKGYPNMTFRPNAQITYAEVVAMLVRATKSISVAEEMTAAWPNTYITKANLAGIIESSAEIGPYNEPAVREKAFVLIYNAMNNADLKAFGNYSIVKAIVLQNNRVRKDLKANEVNVEFMKVMQESDYVANMRKSGTVEGKQKAITLDPKVADVENIFGKVVDLTVDKQGNVVKVTEDKKYVQKLEEISSITDYKFNGYTVNFNERYSNNDERIFVTYNDNMDYKYADFVKAVKDEKINPTHARFTLSDTKNVLFIDAYEFTDVAPIESVKGKDFFFYNDERDGRVDRVGAARFVISYTEKDEFRRIEPAAVAKDDVLHIYRGGMIVRQDAKVEGELKKTYVDRDRDEYVVVEGQEDDLVIVRSKYWRPIYSYEQKEYRTFDSRGVIQPLVGRKVKVLKSIGNTLQLIDGDIKFVGGIAGIESIISRGRVRFLPSHGDKYVGEETFETTYFDKTGKTLNRQLLDNFDIADVVYVHVKEREKDENEIVEMFNLLARKDYVGMFRMAEVTNRYVNIKGTADENIEQYMYSADTNAFVYDAAKKILKPYTMNKAYRDNNNPRNKKLQAVVLSERAVYEALYKKVDLYNFIKDDPRMANTVIFLDTVGTAGDTESRYAEIREIYNYSNEILVAYSNEDEFKNAKDEVVREQVLRLGTWDVVIGKDKDNKDITEKLSNANVGDIMAIQVDKESLKEAEGKAPKVVGMNRIIKSNQFTNEIVSGNRYGTQLKFDNGKELSTVHAKSFGKSYHKYAQVYQRPQDEPWFITVIRYMRDPITKAPEPAKNIITNVNMAEKTITVDHNRAYILDEYVELTKNNELYKGYTDAVKHIMVGDKLVSMKLNANGRIIALEVETMGPPPVVLSDEAKAFIAAVKAEQPKVAAAITANTEAELKAEEAALKALRANYDALPAEQKAFQEVKDAEKDLAKMEKDIADALAPFAGVSFTITAGEALFGKKLYTIKLTNALVKEITSVKYLKGDGTAWTPTTAPTAAEMAANDTDTFEILAPAVLTKGEKIVIEVKGQTLEVAMPTE